MELALLLCLLLAVQYVFSLIQIRYYRFSIDQISKKYKGNNDYFMFSGMDRGKFKPGAIAVLIVDKNYEVHECHMLKGISVLSKFKEVPEYRGKHVGDIIRDLKDRYEDKSGGKKEPAFAKALRNAGENAMITIAKTQIP